MALRHGVPAIHLHRELVAAGGLMSDAGSITDAYHLAGDYTGRIRKGEKPANLPIPQTMKVELFVNFETAKGLSLTIREAILLRPVEVIQ